MQHSTLARRASGAAAIGMALIVATLGGASPASAQAGLSITTPFPAVTVQPGGNVSFELTISASEPARVNLSVDGLPEGWTASLSGGGNEIQTALVNAGAPATVTLAIDVPEDAAGGTTTVTVVGRAGDETARLPVDLNVAEAAGGTVSLESDYPSLRGSADTDFQFNLTLHNDTPQQLTFSLDAQGPAGWTVDVQPSGQTRAASVTVDARGTQRLEVTATPTANAGADTYPITVSTVAGEQQADIELAVEITGTVEMEITTPDQRLNTTANAGSTRDFEVVVANNGSSPLNGVSLTGTGPSEWEITFEPGTISQIAPGDTATSTGHITPSANAVAGDYQITLSASTEEANESMDVRVTVETAPIWGIVGIGLVLLTLGGMVWIFRRYGRR
jgi:uncharacterized membrane protein